MADERRRHRPASEMIMEGSLVKKLVTVGLFSLVCVHARPAAAAPVSVQMTLTKSPVPATLDGTRLHRSVHRDHRFGSGLQSHLR